MAVRKPLITRRAEKCRECGGGTIKREVTLKGDGRSIAWRCTDCDALWLERRIKRA